MRRTSLRRLKLFIGVLVLVVLGSTLYKHIVGTDESNSIEPRLRALDRVAQGLPIDPDIVKLEANEETIRPLQNELPVPVRLP